MPSPVTISGFPDLLDPRFREVWDGEMALEEDFIPKLYSVETPTLETERGTSLTPMELFSEFAGIVSYGGPTQGYNWNTTSREYAKGIQIERKLVEYDQFNVIEGRMKLLARSARQSRQVLAASGFSNAFIVDPNYVHSENVALCSDSHTTPMAGVSTTTGFDNAITDALSPASLKAAYIQGRKFKDNAGQPVDSFEFDELLVPVDLKDRAAEIFETGTGLDTAEGTINVLKGRYRVVDWIRLTDTNNWFLINGSARKENLFWFDKVKPEFARAEDFDGIIAKYRGYYICHYGRADWRWVIGANVS